MKQRQWFLIQKNSVFKQTYYIDIFLDLAANLKEIQVMKSNQMKIFSYL